MKQNAYTTDVRCYYGDLPFVARVTYHKVVPPWPGSCYTAPSDMDYYGYTECEYEVLDRRGRPASWLERKLTQKNDDHIRENIDEYMRKEAD